MPPQPIRILGTTSSDLERAVALITSVIEVGPVAALGMETIKMDCPVDKVPLVIGIKGMTAKEMMRRTGCKIHVNETAPEGSTMCSIELTGTTEQIDQATKIISHVLEFGTKALGKRFQRTFQKGDEGGSEEGVTGAGGGGSQTI
jgi:polyribonucleotide nucleotidyltransferase